MIHGFCLRTTKACVAIALSAGSVMAASGAVIPAGTPLAAVQEMRRNNGDEPESLDPVKVESLPASHIVGDLFEGLTANDNHGALVPGAAASWRQTGLTTWVFKLRAGALWSDGTPVTADDFVYSWRRLVYYKTAAPQAATDGDYILNGVAILKSKGKLPVTALGVRALDSLTLEVKTPRPISFLPRLLALAAFSPVRRAVVEKYGLDWTKPGNLVGNGPYVLKDWQPNNKVVVEKNLKYWDAGNVALTRVVYLVQPDGNADLSLYKSGETDMMLQVPSGSYEKLSKEYPREMHASRLLAMRYYALNNNHPVLKDVRVRKALSMVIDRKGLAQVTADGQLPIYGLTITSTEGVDPLTYDWADWSMEKRVAEGRKLLGEAGVKPGAPLSLAYNGGEYHKKMAMFMSSEWKTKLGLNIRMESMEFKVLNQRLRLADYEIARTGLLFDYPDVTQFFLAVQCGSDFNFDGNCDRQADGLIDQAKATLDPAKRKALMTQALRREMDDYPMIPLLQYSVVRLVKPWIGGYDDANDQDAYRSKDFYILRH